MFLDLRLVARCLLFVGVCLVFVVRWLLSGFGVSLLVVVCSLLFVVVRGLWFVVICCGSRCVVSWLLCVELVVVCSLGC